MLFQTCVLRAIYSNIDFGTVLSLFDQKQKSLVTYMSIRLGIKITEALPYNMEILNIIPPRKLLGFEWVKQLFLALFPVKFWEISERRIFFGHLTRNCPYDSVIFEYILTSLEEWHSSLFSGTNINSRRGKNDAATNIAS